MSAGMKNELIGIIKELEERGAQGIILGCTDLQLVIGQRDVSIPIIDTMEILANSAVQHMGGTNG